jgi:sulfatase maturation enzyme AslB (radical SAM superfamily)
MDHLSFSVSIDGNKQLHDACRVFPDGSGSYDKAIAAVRHYVDVLHGTMGSKMTLAPANIAYTFEAVKGLID